MWHHQYLLQEIMGLLAGKKNRKKKKVEKNRREVQLVLFTDLRGTEGITSIVDCESLGPLVEPLGCYIYEQTI